jgi:hypothetical protein
MNPVRIGAVSATFVDSRIAMPQLLGSGEALDFLVFDCLAEGVVGTLARNMANGQPGYVADFVDAQIAPYLTQLAEQGIRVIANAGGQDPVACAEALRAKIREAGVTLKVASVSGDNLTARADALVTAVTRDMFDGSSVAERLREADRLLSLNAYTGAFPIAAALDAGADIVVTGRAVDSATTLGALIHAFDWREEDYDLLAAGTLVGHLIECTTQLTGGTFTDWQDVPDWANIGFPIATCHADGTAILSKPDGTGGLLSPATVAEQMLYEVSDPQHYRVPDVTCDFSAVTAEQVGPDQVRVAGARGLGRPEQLKCTLTWDQGWRAVALAPIIGHQAAQKARRVAEALFARVSTLARDRQLPAFSVLHHDVIGGTGPGPSTAVCRMVADNPDPRGAQLFAREQSSIMTNMAVGLTAPLGTTVRPVSCIASFTLPRDEVTLSVECEGKPVAFDPVDTGAEPAAEVPAAPPAPVDAEPALTVPLVSLAWARSGDKGDLFNVGVIARRPEFLPYLYAALTPDAVERHYAGMLGASGPLSVDRFSVPGVHALNLVVNSSMKGGMLASPALDPAAKGMAQLLLDFPIPVSPAIATRAVGQQI